MLVLNDGSQILEGNHENTIGKTRYKIIHFHFLFALLNRQHEIGSLRGELVCLILVYISRSLQDTVMCLRAMNT